MLPAICPRCNRLLGDGSAGAVPEPTEAQQAKIEDLTARGIRLETGREIVLVAQGQRGIKRR